MNFMKQTLIMLAACSATVMACFNPADKWSAGIVWSNGEILDYSVITALGIAGTNYYSSEDSFGLSISYRSHYAPNRAMVFLGHFTISFQTNILYSRMAIVVDSTDSLAFDFAAAVSAELGWLANEHVTDMSVVDRQNAESALREYGHGDGQYWTLQKGVLPYNSWYSGDTAGGVWSVNGVRGGCGLDAAFLLPPEELTAIETSTPDADKKRGSLIVSPNPCNPSTKILLDRQWKTGNQKAAIFIYDVRGHLVYRLSTTGYRLFEGIVWNASVNPSGTYVIRVTMDGMTYSRELILLK
ncbi:MAG: hypothetical protein A2268_00375 [Candidatus Raymondbacteria bacterium RifOxyA12_full_50_37]|uniref:Secretion system C-terminal sorting domain-containing protein n=1 Tax=Candidatus Raymondbacteria bacterium RIFOXYD12_FULL_49_13 TaxID=1817890 RepID=A0A1F7F2T5_UNCRA|nr:MAG: hypothetical protein A2268_00375 [Candidatus Raymondbacteria bacterium RifOxyA12_full_50_37]OGJ92772.1 MAG: hypothetical protein A2248_04425 [Candidatus Raymondbacteria bacterium RIFOXYA2_FULL_49_16]OGK00287.1 MAG: hypothetical protein A2350_16630 [Candidatus Raymondbacteria bacterium RifOxyB12_full_50_8]OGK00975.1 MAG: hypothetical protein A2519_17085 [Candidatus Raymondbacteria bacterium RIFOXYD12_FULL_49_13]OGK02461.1 MAG: hypothetical protein A2487_20800 [Candidatus Raymondbacteria 